MHSNFYGAAIALLLSVFNYATQQTELPIPHQENSAIVLDLYSELQTAYNQQQSITIVDLAGNEYRNPTLATLQQIPTELFTMNRIRLSLANNSDDNRCSTEIVLNNDEGGIIGNYTLNTCSSFGWIFFTTSECFQIELFHDAGLEAPFGNQVKGSVDWSFSFNQQPRITGTYQDGGAANMLTVASPCFTKKGSDLLERSLPKRDMRRYDFRSDKLSGQ